MAQLSRSARLQRKAASAFFSAVEIYNKPDFKYREETFAILMVNAWELLLKARLVHNNGNNIKCICIYAPRPMKSGRPSRKLYIRRNRSGNFLTMGLGEIIVALDKYAHSRLPSSVKINLEMLVEIRDNAIHYYNASPLLAKKVLEVGTASVKNFIELSRQWFNTDYTGYGLYLMPIGFVSPPKSVTPIHVSPDEKKLINYLMKSELSSVTNSDDFSAFLEVQIAFKRGAPSDLTSISVIRDDRDPEAIKVTLSEVDLKLRYPWDYAELTKRLRSRYIDFKASQKYHNIREALKTDGRFAWTRELNPGNPKSGKKDFFSPDIYMEFDKHYTRGP